MGNEVKFIVNAETRQAAANLQNFLSVAASGFARVAGPLAALVSAGGLLTLAKQSLNAADAMGKAAQLAGVAAKEFAGMAYAADRDEVDLGSLRVALKELSKDLSATGQGSKNLKDALLEQADVFAKMPDGIEKNNLAIKTFGRSGLQMVPFLNQGAASMKEMFERGERLTGVNDDLAKSADEYNDALKDLHIASVGLAGSLVSSFIPALTRTINTITEGIVGFREWAKQSDVFRISVQTLAVGLGILASIKIGTLGIAGLTAIIGAGAIVSLADFIAAIRLLPAACAAAAASLATLAAAVAAVTAAVVLASAWWDYNKAQLAKVEADLIQTQATEKLTEVLKRKIAVLKEEGKISEEEFKAFQRRIIEANKLSDQSALAGALGGIKEDLKSRVPAEFQKSPLAPGVNQDAEVERLKQLTELKDRTEQLHIARMDGIDRERAAEVERFRLETNAINEQAKLVKDEDAAQMARLENELLHRKTLRDLEAKEAAEQIKKVLELQNLQDELQLAEWDHLQRVAAERRQQAIDKIQGSPFLTDAEKYDQSKAAGADVSNQVNPGSFMENLSANIVGLQNQLGTFSQAAAALVTNGIGSAIQGVSDGIMGLIDGTKTWAQTWGSVLKSMAGQGIQFIVQQTAAFLLNKGKELLIHLTTESAKTTATVAGSATRTTAIAGEASMEAVATGAKAAGSVADIPYVGWALAIAAFAGVIAMVASATSNARALGGPVRSGETYLVGERGPEIFHAPANGGILNNADTMKVMSGSGGAKSGGASGGTAAGNTVVNTIVVADIQAAIQMALKMPANQQTIIQTMDGRRMDAGFDT